MLSFLRVLDVVADAKKVDLVLDISNKLDKLARSLGFDESLSPHSLHMSHSLLIEQKLKHSCILDTFIRADIVVGFFFSIVEAVVLHAINLLFLLFDQLGELISQLIEIVVHITDFLLS